MKKLIIILAAAIAMSAAAIDTTIAYQGVLRDAQGNVLSTRAQTIIFRLYSQASGGTPLWARAVAVNLDETGLFNVELSDVGTSVDGAQHETLVEALKAARGGTLFVGLEVANSSGEIAPRQKILMTPYASWAADATNASGDFTVGGKATLNSAEVTGNLAVSGATTLRGNAVFDNDVTIAGGLTVKNTGSFTGYGTIPVGGIIMWSGSPADIPDGWALCDGRTSNGRTTPNLSGKFIVGYSSSDSDYNPVGKTGGEKKHTLTVAEMPSHTHNMKFKSYDLAASWKDQRNFYTVSKGTEDQTKTSESAGSGQSHENRPPYYALCFIMRVK